MDSKRAATEDSQYFFIDPEKISNKIVPFLTLTFWLSKEKKIKGCFIVFINLQFAKIIPMIEASSLYEYIME